MKYEQINLDFEPKKIELNAEEERREIIKLLDEKGVIFSTRKTNYVKQQSFITAEIVDYLDLLRTKLGVAKLGQDILAKAYSIYNETAQDWMKYNLQTLRNKKKQDFDGLQYVDDAQKKEWRDLKRSGGVDPNEI